MVAKGQASQGRSAHESGVYRASEPARLPWMGRVLIFHDPLLGGVFRDPRLAERVEALSVNAGADPLREVERLRPDLILLDPVLLGDRCLEMIATLRQRAAQSALFVVTAASASVVSQCLAAGACGAIAKPVQFEELLLVVGAALHRKLMREEETPSESRPSVVRLTERNLRIVECVARGLRNKEIAAEVHVSEKRVEALLTRILRDVGVKRREELTSWYAGCKEGNGR